MPGTGSAIKEGRIEEDICYRGLLRIGSKEKTNEEVIRRVNNRNRLATVLDERTLSFVRHQLRKFNSFEKTQLIGSVYGKR